MICPSPRARRLAGVVAALLVTGAAAACGQPNPAGASSGAVPVGSTASIPAEPSGAPSAADELSAPIVPPADPPTTAPAPTKPAKPKNVPQPAKPKNVPQPAPPLPGVSAAAQAVLEQTNAWRAAAGLRPYVMLSGLVASAHKHNLRMSAGCGLSHQCPGEAPFGDRIHAEGVQWSSAGENCGQGGAANNAAAITAAAKGLNQDMFDEKPPGDGHRRNLLSSSFTHIGIDVIRDSNGSVWLTQDFTS